MPLLAKAYLHNSQTVDEKRLLPAGLNHEALVNHRSAQSGRDASPRHRVSLNNETLTEKLTLLAFDKAHQIDLSSGQNDSWHYLWTLERPS